MEAMPVRTAVDHAVRMDERKRTCELLREGTDLVLREVSLVVDDIKSRRGRDAFWLPSFASSVSVVDGPCWLWM